MMRPAGDFMRPEATSYSTCPCGTPLFGGVAPIVRIPVAVLRETRSQSGVSPFKAPNTSPLRAGWGDRVLLDSLLELTIVYEDAGDGWITASVAEVPGVNSQGHTRAEARENVIEAMHGILELRVGEHALTEPAADSGPCIFS